MRVAKPLLDLLRYWRSLDLLYHPFYGLPLLIVNVLLIAALHWWSLFFVLPLFALVVYVFHLDEFGGTREHPPS